MQLQSSDIWILLALQGCNYSHDLDISTVIAKADCINHAIPTFEEFNNAVYRLKAKGLIQINHTKIKLTAYAEQLINAKSKIPILKTWELLEKDLKAAPYSAKNKLADFEAADLFVSKSEFEIQVDKYLVAPEESIRH